MLASLVDQLFVEPTTTVNGVAKSLDVQFSTARTLIDKLVKAGIVREVTGQSRNRVFLAQGVVDVFSTDVPANEDNHD
jgi:ribosomal protein S25